MTLFVQTASESDPLITNAADEPDKETLGSRQCFSSRFCVVVSVISLLIAGLVFHAVWPSSDLLAPSHGVHAYFHMAQMESSHALQGALPDGWAEQFPCPDEHTFTLSLALKQSNMDHLADHVDAVSNPEHTVTGTFRRYWTVKQIRDYFAPAQETVDAVVSWLHHHGISGDRVSLSDGHRGNVVRAQVTCAEANELLSSQFMFYENEDTMKTHLRVKDGLYHLPRVLVEHVDFVHPTMRFPPRHHSRSQEKLQLQNLNLNSADGDGDDADLQALAETYNTPVRLYKMYGIDADMYSVGDTTADVDSDTRPVRQAVASYISQYYSDDDLSIAWSSLGYFGGNALSEMERVPDDQPQGEGSEAELDTQYITATGAGLHTYVFYVDDDDDPFVTLIEDVMDAEVPPEVVSISYGGDEYEYGAHYVHRINQDFGKLALLGTTVLVSSGDSGALGNMADCSANEGRYSVSFPASATYVTAVGGAEGGSSLMDEVDGEEITGETAWFYSGGGFSQYFETPQWQSRAVDDYFGSNTAATMPNAKRYVSGMRGVPDIAAQSTAYIVALDGEYYAVSGTSCSAPLVAGMVSMLNVQRAQKGEAPLGFLNPALYAMFEAQSHHNQHFNDVVDGENEGCLEDDGVAWSAAVGWDPLTGVGTPKFEQLLRQL